MDSSDRRNIAKSEKAGGDIPCKGVPETLLLTTETQVDPLATTATYQTCHFEDENPSSFEDKTPKYEPIPFAEMWQPA